MVRITDDFPLADVEAFYPIVDLLGDWGSLMEGGFRVLGFGFWVLGLGIGVWGLGFGHRVKGLGLGFRV